jgi:hypothetical protein
MCCRRSEQTCSRSLHLDLVETTVQIDSFRALFSRPSLSPPAAPPIHAVGISHGWPRQPDTSGSRFILTGKFSVAKGRTIHGPPSLSCVSFLLAVLPPACFKFVSDLIFSLRWMKCCMIGGHVLSPALFLSLPPYHKP